MQRKSKPLAWRAKGLSDTLDASDTFMGAMSSLQNLIPHPSTKMLWQCRPAAIEKLNFATAGSAFSSGFSGGFGPTLYKPPDGPITLWKVIGNYGYGMAQTSDFPGHDVPFVVNLASMSFVPITGMTSANTPIAPPSTGPWTPPAGVMVGAKFVVTHPGFSGTGTNFVGIIDVSSPIAPAWSTAQLTGAGGVTFTIPPSAVAQFNGRAYYIHNLQTQPAVIFSDSLNPTVVSNAGNILTFGDAVPLTALGTLGLKNQLGGIVQALMVFKGVQNIYQITGDPTTSNLSVNALNITTGTLAPNSVVNTPKGLTFMSPDGLRNIDFYATVSDPIGMDGMGITMPFIYSVTPSRVAAACGGNVMRITTQNGNAPAAPNQEYWFDVARQIWSGPHTFPFGLIQPFNNTFMGVPVDPTLVSTIWQSDVVQTTLSTFVENGQQMGWVWATPLLPDADQLSNNTITESSIDFQFAPSVPVLNAAFLTEQQTVIDAVQIRPLTVAAPTIWGSFTWGTAPWGGVASSFSPYLIPWNIPLTFARGVFQLSAPSAGSVVIGALHLRLQVLRYIVNQGAAA
jgi:hypothetical protein